MCKALGSIPSRGRAGRKRRGRGEREREVKEEEEEKVVGEEEEEGENERMREKRNCFPENHSPQKLSKSKHYKQCTEESEHTVPVPVSKEGFVCMCLCARTSVHSKLYVHNLPIFSFS